MLVLTRIDGAIWAAEIYALLLFKTRRLLSRPALYGILYHGGPLFEREEERSYFLEHYSEVQRFAAPLPAQWGKFSCLTVYRRMR